MPIPNFVAVDTETTGLDPWKGDRMLCVGAWFPNGTTQFWRGEFGGLRELLLDESIDKVFQNAKFDWRMLEFAGFEIKGKIWDSMIFAHLLDGRQAEGGLGLEQIARRYLPAEFRKITTEVDEAFIAMGVNPKKDALNFERLSPDLVRRRCLGDAELTGRFFMKAFNTVHSVFPWLVKNEHRLLPVVKKMEDRGVLINPQEIEDQFGYFDDIVTEVTDWFECYLGKRYFSLTSRTDQLAVVERGGFHDLLMDVDPNKPGKPTRLFLDDYHLRHVAHPAAAMLLVGKAAIKMRDTFLNQMLRCSSENVIHPSYNQVGTGTGRFSCSKPNLQNIPIEGDRRTAYTEEESREAVELTGIRYAPHIKRIFKVRPGYGHLHSDKKQAEMIMVAHYANDEVMKGIFARNESVHDGLCRALYGEWTKGLKTRTKAVVFGFIYGAGLETLSRKIGGSLSDARSARSRLEQTLPALPRWKNKLIGELREQGFVTSIHGRRHYIDMSGSYKSVNYICQGSVGDEIKHRMVALDDYMVSNGIDGRVVMNIHDDIATEFPADMSLKIVPDLNQIMQEHDPALKFNLALPSTCDVTYTRWSDLVEVDWSKPVTDYSPEVMLPKAEAKMKTETHSIFAEMQ